MLYALKNENNGSWWDGGYQFELGQRYGQSHPARHLPTGFSLEPRLFKNPVALLQSLNKRPASWREEFLKTSDGNWQSEYAAWDKYVKDNKLKSIDILKMFESQGWYLYSMENLSCSLSKIQESK